MSVPIAKKEVRKKVFAERKKYTDSEFEQKSHMACVNVREYLSGIPAYEPLEEIYIYASYGRETDTSEMIRACLKQNIRVAVPRVCEDLENMEFYYIESLDDLQVGYKGIPEPALHCKMAIPSRKDSYMILPGVGFDLHGNRTGYGKGFYDRYLMKHPDFIKIGMCFEEQIFEMIEHTALDISMNAVITERRVIVFES